MAQKAELVLERSYKASLKEIWDLWTTKDGFESWWGPQGFRVEVAKLEAREGGELRYAMIAATPEMIAGMKAMGQAASHAVTSTFSEFNPMTRLVLRNVIDFLPGVAAYESLIAVDFREADGKVSMVTTLQGMHSEEFTRMQLEGYSSQLTKLDGRFG